MVPCGLSSVTSWSTMCCGHLNLQATGMLEEYPHRGVMVGPGNHIPPAPVPEASWCPSATGGRGTSSAMRVGRVAMCLCIHRKSSRASCTPLCNATRPPDLFASAFCIVLKMLRDPGRASAMERSSPRTACHFRRLVRRWVRGMDARISASRSIR